MKNVFRTITSDPEKFQERIAPLAGQIRVRPARGVNFDIAVRAARLGNISLFTVKSPTIIVDISPPHDYFCLNIPLGKPFSVIESRQRYGFSNHAHLLMPEQHMHLEAANDCRVLAVKLNSERVIDCANNLNQCHGSFESAIHDIRPDSLTPSNPLIRGIAGLWSDIQRGDASLASEISLAEREDALFTQFILAMQCAEALCSRHSQQADTATMARAEEYLRSRLIHPVSRAELAAASGVSIRTLSRGFTRRWGTGPMGFLKRMRLEATYRDLLGGEPDTTSVTEIASRYGFTHFGKFAGEYRRAFHELPSETLRH